MIFNHVVTQENGQKMRAYVARPDGGVQGPGLVLLHEVYGVNDGLKIIADDYAARGFVVYCPNMYWRNDEDASFRPQAPGEEMTPELERQRNAARHLMYDLFDYSKVPGDITAVVDAVRRDPACNGKVGAMGFCLGGKNTYLAAVNDIVDAGVSFYPTPAVSNVFAAEQAAKAKTPLLFIVGGQDPYISVEEKETMVRFSGQTNYYIPGQQQTVQATNPAGNTNIVTLYFAANGHAFARPCGKDNDPALATHLHNLTEKFLRAAFDLGPSAAAAVAKQPVAMPDSKTYLPAYKK